MSSTNILTITDNSGAITSINYVTGAPLHVTSGESHDAAPTISKNGNVFTISFNCNRKSSSSIAASFNAASGGGPCEYAAYDGGGTPDELHFWFQLTINFTGTNGSGSATLNVGQGRSGLRNNWWLGGSIVNSVRPRLELPYLNTTYQNTTWQFNIPISGDVSAYTFWAGTSTIWSPIRYIFVLMLENHSFDNMFAGSGLHGIDAATTANSNTYNGTRYPVTYTAQVCMPTDPGHEFEDVVQQLCGQSAQYQPNHNYPRMDNSGFVYNYATSQTEGTGPTPSSDIGDVMACFDTPNQLPVLYQLATKFVLCDHWFSSLPGPTWPNRFFLHGASSNGLDDSPSHQQMADWLSGIGNVPQGSGFAYPHGSIFDALRNKNIEYRIYADWNNSFSDDPQGISYVGGTPQVASLHNITAADAYWLKGAPNGHTFDKALQQNYTAQYTFIEPNYGNVVNDTYAGGSSQHPMDDVYGGEALIKYVYESIRNSPLWHHSMLIITYDEHGGFYDSSTPPSCLAPQDSLKNYNRPLA